jgi:alpha-tubulin suppressor-like RCC1 family protein
MKHRISIFVIVSASVVTLGYGRAIAQNVAQVTAGVGHTCARVSDGSVRCWGVNADGQLGDGTLNGAELPVPVSGLSNALVVSAGDDHTCAVLSDGSVRCWGLNADGQLGDGTTARRTSPVAVSGLSGVVGLSAGGAHTCALHANGTVSCWGSNSDGQLGDGTVTDRLTPVNVFGLSGATSVAVGYTHGCALLSNGTASCWGYNVDGQLGSGNTSMRSTTPVAVSTLTGATAIAVGWDHGCALLGSGSVRCWGYNFYGEVGDGTTVSRSAPVAVTGVSNATRIAAGHDRSCAVLSNGSLLCWGSNLAGEIGDGTTGGIRSTPVAVIGMSESLSLALGQRHTCALRSDSAVLCWGDNADGQLGNGLELDSPTPVRAQGLPGTPPVPPVPWGGPLAAGALMLVLSVIGASFGARRRNT